MEILAEFERDVPAGASAPEFGPRGDWATGARVNTAAFRNWDFPQRRQIFSGIRIGRDL